MGAPTSSALIRTYNKQIYQILIKQIITYFSYIVDMILIYDQNKTQNKHSTDSTNYMFVKLQCSNFSTMDSCVMIAIYDQTCSKEEE
jgi:hypothetical protein